jgi:hypothetical protein
MVMEQVFETGVTVRKRTFTSRWQQPLVWILSGKTFEMETVHDRLRTAVDEVFIWR